MSIVLYHRTMVKDARTIAKDGFVNQEVDLGLRDAFTGHEVPAHGVWLADRPVTQADILPGDALLEVTIEATETDLRRFELEGLLWDTKVWVVEAGWLNQRMTMRIAEVDASASGFFQPPPE